MTASRPRERLLRGEQFRELSVAEGSVTTIRATNLGGRYATYKRHPGLGGSSVARRSPSHSKWLTVDGHKRSFKEPPLKRPFEYTNEGPYGSLPRAGEDLACPMPTGRQFKSQSGASKICRIAP
jgi:hypothetical protein